MNSNTLKILEFTRYPGPRYRRLGDGSGEEFRQDYLSKAISEFGDGLLIDLDGAFGYGSSFLEESFGGLIRDGQPADTVLAIVKNLKSDEDPSLRDEIRAYVKEAIKAKKEPPLKQHAG